MIIQEINRQKVQAAKVNLQTKQTALDLLSKVDLGLETTIKVTPFNDLLVEFFYLGNRLTFYIENTKIQILYNDAEVFTENLNLAHAFFNIFLDCAIGIPRNFITQKPSIVTTNILNNHFKWNKSFHCEVCGHIFEKSDIARFVCATQTGLTNFYVCFNCDQPNEQLISFRKTILDYNRKHPTPEIALSHFMKSLYLITVIDDGAFGGDCSWVTTSQAKAVKHLCTHFNKYITMELKELYGLKTLETFEDLCNFETIVKDSVNPCDFRWSIDRVELTTDCLE